MKSDEKAKVSGAGVGVAVGVAAAAAAAAAGAYWLYGSKDADKHRRQVRGWMLRARAEVLEAVEKLQEVSKEQYMEIVEGVMSRYAAFENVSASELAAMARELKSTWDYIQKTKKRTTTRTTVARKRAVGAKAKRAKRRVNSSR
jgi:hypothetical protein